MLTKSPYLLIISVLINVNVYASTLFFSGDDSIVFELDQISELPAGSYVSIGYFDDGFDFSTIPNQTWSELLNTSYNEIPGSFTISPAGRGAGSASADNIEGELLYVWVFDTLDTPARVDEQEFGLFTSTSSTEWIGKGDNPLTDFNNLLIDDINVAEYGSIVNGGIALAPVPEPSTYALLISVFALSYSFIRRFRAEI